MVVAAIVAAVSLGCKREAPPPPPETAPIASAVAERLAWSDQELAAAVTLYLGRFDEEELGMVEQNLALASYAFIVHSDDGLAWYVQDTMLQAVRTRDALRAVGLEEHARIFDDLVAKYSKRRPPTHDESEALDARWEAAKSDTDAAFARYIRANHHAIRLAKVPHTPWYDAGHDAH